MTQPAYAERGVLPRNRRYPPRRQPPAPHRDPSRHKVVHDGLAPGQLFEALLRVRIELSVAQPVGPAFEDLHWADRSTRIY